MKKLFPILIFSLSFSVLANDLGEKALKFVPEGTVQNVEKDEVKVKTANDTIVEIEFTRSGELDEASGDKIESDNFVPGDGSKTLQEIASELNKRGYKLKGDWSFDKGIIDPWHYEVEAFYEGKEVDVKIDAKTANILKSEIDD